MTAPKHPMRPDFFEDPNLDPVAAATRNRSAPPSAPKKKAGFYLSENLLQRFNTHFHRMKLEGVAIDNKSALVEAALSFALDDLDKGVQSGLLKIINRR